MEIKFSNQAKKLLKNIPDFNEVDFLVWYKEKISTVGTSHIVEYLLGGE